MISLLSQVGLKIIETFGENDKSPYTQDSRRMIILSQKL
jgi:hypothetical protein